MNCSPPAPPDWPNSLEHRWNTTKGTAMNVQPYLFFDGRCQEAIDFYRKAVGAEVETVMHWKDAPDAAMANAANKDKVMHASFRIGDAHILASDGDGTGKPKFEGFSLTLTAADDAEAERLFESLGKGGKVTMPMSKTFFASRFGMLTDKFGVGWMVMASQ
jgi:PhnB protein